MLIKGRVVTVATIVNSSGEKMENGVYFIRCTINDETKDIFCHYSDIETPHSFKRLYFGDTVIFEYDEKNRNKHGIIAKKVRCVYPDEEV